MRLSVVWISGAGVPQRLRERGPRSEELCHGGGADSKLVGSDLYPEQVCYGLQYRETYGFRARGYSNKLQNPTLANCS